MTLNGLNSSVTIGNKMKRLKIALQDKLIQDSNMAMSIWVMDLV